MDFKLDRYTLNARLAPMLITLMPVGLAVLSLFPAKSSNLALVVGVVTYCGMLVLLSNMGRDLGRNMQIKLFKKWGGSPTSKMLDPNVSQMPKTQLSAIHASLKKLTNVSLPENAGPQEKEDVFETWTTYLRTNTRGQDNGQFRLILSENISFGFRRNLYGLRWIGFALAIVALGIVIGDHTIITRGGEPWHIDMLALRPVAKAAILVTVWTALVFLFVVRESWVKTAAEAYAKQLLEGVFVLGKGEM